MNLAGIQMKLGNNKRYYCGQPMGKTGVCGPNGGTAPVFSCIPVPESDDWNILTQAHSVTTALATWLHIHMH